MGDKGGKKDKEKNKQQQSTKQKQGAQQARQRPGEEALGRNSVKPGHVRGERV